MEKHTNTKGRKIEEFINKDLCLLNDFSNTYLHPGHGTYSAIGQTLCKPEEIIDFSWQVRKDLCRSDHYPLIITSTEDDNQQDATRWQLKKAHWYIFKTLLWEIQHRLERKSRSTKNSDTLYKNSVPNSRNICSKISTKSCSQKNTLFNKDCKIAIADQKKTEWNFSKDQTTENLIRLNICTAQAWRTINKK